MSINTDLSYPDHNNVGLLVMHAISLHSSHTYLIFMYPQTLNKEDRLETTAAILHKIVDFPILLSLTNCHVYQASFDIDFSVCTVMCACIVKQL